MTRASIGALVGVLVWTITTDAPAQQVHVSTPLVRTSDSFYENFGINWGFRWRGPHGMFFFDRGGGAAWPPFGGFNPASGAHFGFAGTGNRGGLYFNLNAASGSRRSIVSEVPSLVVPNGGAGFISDTTWRPFVTGLVPVVGGSVTSPLLERLERLRHEGEAVPTTSPAATVAAEIEPAPAAPRRVSSAERGDISVAEIRRRQELTRTSGDAEMHRQISLAREAEQAGRYGAARIRYRQAASRADGALKTQLLEQLEALRDRK